MKKLTIILYGVFLLLFTIFSYAFVDQNLSYLKNIYSGFAFSNRLLTTVFYISSVIIFFIFYINFIYLGVKRRITLKELFMLLGMTAAILIFSYPAILSYDIFNYMATSKVLFIHHENPYIVMPVEFIGDPLLAFIHAANKVALYGPFWILLTGVPYSIGFGNFVATLFSFKLFIIIFYFFTIFFVWKISKNVISIILFSLNPLVVIETLISGHNDIVMIFLAFLSFFLLMRKRIFLGVLFLVLSIFIKYATILLIPIFLYAAWKMIKNKGVNWTKVYFFSSLMMLIAFLLSPIREEIYPWYAIWFLSFVFLIPNNKLLLYVSTTFSFSLLFRYVPYMLTGTYAGLTPFLKEIISFAFPILVFIYYGIKKKI